MTMRRSRQDARVRQTAMFSCVAVAGAVFAATPAAQARVTQIVITKTELPAYGGKSFGTVGQYERISGRIIGEVDPKDPVNRVIMDIDLAVKNPNGTAPYATDFQILRPIDRAKANKRLLYEITNRGRTNVLGTLNDSRTENDTESAGDPGNGFLMRQGYTILDTGWDFSAPRNGKSFTATVPVAKNPDGSLDHRPQHRRIRHRQERDPGPAAAHLSGRERR